MVNLLSALALVLVIEGLLPLIAPQAWRNTFERMLQFNDGQLRFIGLMSIIGGLVLLYFSQ